MNNKKRLGSIPKGLEWIEQVPDSNEEKTHSTSAIDTETEKIPKAKSYHAIEKMTSAHRGLPIGWRRATLIIRDGHFKKLKAISYWDRTSIKDIVDQALESFLSEKRVRSLDVKK